MDPQGSWPTRAPGEWHVAQAARKKCVEGGGEHLGWFRVGAQGWGLGLKLVVEGTGFRAGVQGFRVFGLGGQVLGFWATVQIMIHGFGSGRS